MGHPVVLLTICTLLRLALAAGPRGGAVQHGDLLFQSHLGHEVLGAVLRQRPCLSLAACLLHA